MLILDVFNLIQVIKESLLDGIILKMTSYNGSMVDHNGKVCEKKTSIEIESNQNFSNSSAFL